MPKLPEEVRRKQILKATVAAIEKYGINNFSLRHVKECSTVPVGISTIRGFYKKRTDLIKAVHGSDVSSDELKTTIEENCYV